MFANAISLAQEYTLPVIVSKRLFSGEVQCGVATFIVINDEGWILTAAHVIEDLFLAQEHGPLLTDYYQKKKNIEENSSLIPKEKQRKIGKLTVNREWITNNSYWWGRDGIRINEFSS